MIRPLKAILSIDPIKYPLTGIGRYAYELAHALSRSDQLEELRFFRGAGFSDAVPLPAQIPGGSDGIRRLLGRCRIAIGLYRAAVPRFKGWRLRGLEDHIFHGPNFYLPPFKGRSIVTIHDLSPYLWSECHPPERIRFMLPQIEFSMGQASVVITDSEYVRHEVADYFSWPLRKIHAIPLASSEDFHPRETSSVTSLLNRYKLSPGGYCLFAGTIEPRKNVHALLNAYAMLPMRVRQKWPLILAGYKGWNSAGLHERMADAARAGWARYIGFVPADDLPVLFAGARLFVFPSLYEGFGLPVLEAMASGVPVVCSHASALPEVAGDAAAMSDANDVDALCAHIARGLEDDKWRSIAIDKGLARAAQFSWQRCAEETIAAYRAALSL